MKVAQVEGVVRALLAALGGMLVAQGLLDEGTWATISGAVLTLGTAAWSIYDKRRAEERRLEALNTPPPVG